MRPAEKIERLVKDTTVTTNPKVNDAVLKSLLDRMDEAHGSRQAPEPDTWRIVMKSNKFRFAAAAAIIVIAGIVCMQFVGGTNAYAQVVEQIRNARTMTFTHIRQTGSGTGQAIKADMAYKEPGHMRVAMPDGYIGVIDVNSHKAMSVANGRYHITDVKDMKMDGDPIAEIEAMRALPATADKRLEAKDIDGAQCDGYQVTQGDLTTVVWLDSRTGDVVQVEQKYASAPGMNTIMRDIKLDVPLEDSLFALTPPAGSKQRIDMKSDPTAQTEAKFVERLEWWAKANVDGLFPPVVGMGPYYSIAMDMRAKGKLKGEYWEHFNPSDLFNAMLFVANLPKESNWRYAGEGVKLGTPDTPIFWYKPAGQELYRVIYADMSIKELPADQLPK
jgi:outer membrane lipoprotein-sorting protein